jgi:hypothetical protein
VARGTATNGPATRLSIGIRHQRLERRLRSQRLTPRLTLAIGTTGEG